MGILSMQLCESCELVTKRHIVLTHRCCFFVLQTENNPQWRAGDITSITESSQQKLSLHYDIQHHLSIITSCMTHANSLICLAAQGVIASEEEDEPVAVEETYSGNYVVVFDPLDGSSNIDAGISTGSIFGVYAPSEECKLDDMDDPNKMMENCLLNTCQPGQSFMPLTSCLSVMLLTGRQVLFSSSSSYHVTACMFSVTPQDV